MNKQFLLISLFVFLFSGNVLAKNLKNPPKHVIIIGLDGFSSYSLNQGAQMPNLRKLMQQGSYTLENRSILPSASACNWASMFMGAGPELHGFNTWGSKKPDLPSRVTNKYGMFPNLFGLYRDVNPKAEIGYIYEWDGMNYLIDTMAVSYKLHAPQSERNIDGCLTPGIDYITYKKPNLCAVIFGEPDHVGHTKGWESKEYFEKLIELDGAIGKIVEAVERAGIMDETVIMVVSDHGGINTGHGGITMKEMQTPIVFYGKGIKKNYQIKESTMVYDIGATVGYMLKIKQPQVWIARPIVSVFK